jgi:signal transduction histidine kinase
MDSQKLCILVCASFALETDALTGEEGLGEVVFINYPNRCGRPKLTWDDVREAVGTPEQYGAIRIFGGFCLSGLQEPPEDLRHCRTTQFEHCFELIASKRTLSRLVSEGSYLVSSGWLADWRRHISEWGFDKSTAREFFADCSRQIVMLDTATSESAVTDLEQFSLFVDRPSTMIPVGLDLMSFRMRLCLEAWRSDSAKKAEQLAQRQQSEYAMAFDLLTILTRSLDESTIIRQTINLYHMLFAASDVTFVRFSDGLPVDVIHAGFGVSPDDTLYIEEAAAFAGECRIVETGNSFLLKVRHGVSTLGVVRVSEIAMPEYIDRYLDLTQATIGICALALINARAFKDIADKNRELAHAHAALKSTHMQLLQQEKMASIGQLAAGVAHEINNPMGFITSNLSTLGKYVARMTEYLGAAELLITNSAVPEKEELTLLRSRLKLDYIVNDTKQLIEESLDGATRVKRIVNDLKNFSRTDQDEPVCADLNQCLESTLNIACNEIKYVADIDLQLGVIPAVVCHPQQLSQVFINLLTNAGQAIEGHGTITVRSWSNNNCVFIAVTDTGQGIPEAIRKRIFEPFFTTKDVGKGTGLGLSISYEIIKKHGGDITVESDVGVGTTFIVRLPVTQVEQPE